MKGKEKRAIKDEYVERSHRGPSFSINQSVTSGRYFRFFFSLSACRFIAEDYLSKGIGNS